MRAGEEKLHVPKANVTKSGRSFERVGTTWGCRTYTPVCGGGVKCAYVRTVPGGAFSYVIDRRVRPVLRVRRRQRVLLPPQRSPQPLRHIPLLFPPPADAAEISAHVMKVDRDTDRDRGHQTAVRTRSMCGFRRNKRGHECSNWKQMHW